MIQHLPVYFFSWLFVAIIGTWGIVLIAYGLYRSKYPKLGARKVNK